MAYVRRQAAYTPNRAQSAVNSAPMTGLQERRISRVYRDCMQAGFKRRLAAEVAENVPADIPLYSHNTTYQGYFARGWQAVTAIDIIKAKYQAKADAARAANGITSPQEAR